MRNIRVKEYFKNEATRCGPIAEIANVPQAGKLGNNLLQLERHQRVRGDVISLNYACNLRSRTAPTEQNENPQLNSVHLLQ